MLKVSTSTYGLKVGATQSEVCATQSEVGTTQTKVCATQREVGTRQTKVCATDSLVPGAVKLAAMKLSRRSDYERWKNPDSCLAWWSSRTERIARLIPERSRVLEFGAGTRQLERLLSAGCEYVPSDLVDRGPGTVICDLNQRPLPDLTYLKANVAVFAGVLEYINELPSLVKWLSHQTQMCVASYDCVKTSPYSVRRIREVLRRAAHGYLSYYSEQDLIALFNACGFTCTETLDWRDQKLFVFAKSQ